MHGLQHNVIEIKDTRNEDIERILIFLRPGEHKINVDATRKDAQDILRKVKVKRARPRLSFFAKMLLWLAVSLAALVCTIIYFL